MACKHPYRSLSETYNLSVRAPKQWEETCKCCGAKRIRTCKTWDWTAAKPYDFTPWNGGRE